MKRDHSGKRIAVCQLLLTQPAPDVLTFKHFRDLSISQWCAQLEGFLFLKTEMNRLAIERQISEYCPLILTQPFE
jgi:hypothetical protein